MKTLLAWVVVLTAFVLYYVAWVIRRTADIIIKVFNKFIS